MWRWTKRTLIGLCGLVALAAFAGATYQWIATRKDLAANPPPGRLVEVGGHKLHIWCTGSGAPSVILESGLGGSSADWGFVQPEVAAFTRVCSYDRAGMGYSDPGPSPRTTRRIAHELGQLLDRAGISGPLVLVGASVGGLAARVFASSAYRSARRPTPWRRPYVVSLGRPASVPRRIRRRRTRASTCGRVRRRSGPLVAS